MDELSRLRCQGHWERYNFFSLLLLGGEAEGLCESRTSRSYISGKQDVPLPTPDVGSAASQTSFICLDSSKHRPNRSENSHGHCNSGIFCHLFKQNDPNQAKIISVFSPWKGMGSPLLWTRLRSAFRPLRFWHIFPVSCNKLDSCHILTILQSYTWTSLMASTKKSQ